MKSCIFEFIPFSGQSEIPVGTEIGLKRDV
jgi:hypothetical protein